MADTEAKLVWYYRIIALMNDMPESEVEKKLDTLFAEFKKDVGVRLPQKTQISLLELTFPWLPHLHSAKKSLMAAMAAAGGS